MIILLLLEFSKYLDIIKPALSHMQTYEQNTILPLVILYVLLWKTYSFHKKIVIKISPFILIYKLTTILIIPDNKPER